MRGKHRAKLEIRLEALELRRLMAADPVGFNQTFDYVQGAPGVQLTGLDMSSDDPNEALTATLALADPSAGTLGGQGGGSFNANTGTWTVTGNMYTVGFALQNLWFHPAASYDQNTTITAQVTDSNQSGPTPGMISLNVDPTSTVPVMHHFVMPPNVISGGDEDSGFGIYNQNGYDGPGSGFAPYITDLAAGPNTVMQMTISAAHTSITLGDATGVAFITGDGTDDHTMVFTGTLDAINNALSVVYGWQDADYYGWEHVVFTIDDLGLTGAPQTAQYSYDFEIDAWPDSPVAQQGTGDRSANEGDQLSFDAAESYDVDGDALTYLWDFGDGTQTTGATANHIYAVDGVYTVTLTVDDGSGWTQPGVSTIEVTIANLAPTGSLAGSTVGVRGQTLSFTGTASDAGVMDNLEVAWDFGDEQTIDYAPASSQTLASSHVYTAKGSFIVTMSVRDDSNATAVFTQNVSIGDVTLQQDPLDPSKTALLVGGTTGNDTILITQASNGRLRATINGVTNGKTYQPTGHVIVYALGGANLVDVADKITVSAVLNGGSGKDTLDGGGGADVLLGRKGNDKLVGRSGRDLLVGGAGSDMLDGGEGDDLFLAGTWASEYDDAAIAPVMNEWTRSDHNYLQRVKALRGDAAGFSGSFRINAATVSDDATADVLTGAGGRDWFCAAPAGPAMDLFAAGPDEIVTAIV